MKNSFIHIVAFDNPFPPSYGGIIDIFYKIKALHDEGVLVILHVFLYDGKEPAKELTGICHKVYYYNRRRFTNPFTGDLPYIVTTRNDEALLHNLVKDKHPVLFEGLHTTYFLDHKKLKNKFKIVRTHNVEHLYYKALEEAESGFFKKYFFRVESERLLRYEDKLSHSNVLATISPAETQYYASKHERTHYVPAFHGNNEVTSRPGRGKFVLYHGNLGVGENNKAALYLMHEVFSKLSIPVVIAGNNASKQLHQSVKSHDHVKLVDKISSDDILELVAEAHINILVTFQSTGIKLKLLNSLFMGRHCVVNEEMVVATGLESLCHQGATGDEMVNEINRLWDMDFTEDEVQKRRNLLGKDFNNQNSAKCILALMK